MPVNCDDSTLAENVYVELPPALETSTLPFTCQSGRERHFSGNVSDLSIEEKIQDDAIRPNWRDAFNGKWPYLTPLFLKSEEDTLSKIQEQSRHLENAFNQSTTSLNTSQWEGSIRDIWSGSHRNVNEAFEIESSDPIADRPSRCEKSCRRLLCAFLGFSILGAILAGLGLSLILTSYTGARQLSHKEDIHAVLTSKEQTYLTKTFCDLVEALLKGVEFPVEKGLASCQSYMKLIEDTEDVHILLKISPREGFTIKEKLRRALKEEILAEGAYRLKHSDTCIYVGDTSSQIRCLVPDVNVFNRSKQDISSETINASILTTPNQEISPIMKQIEIDDTGQLRLKIGPSRIEQNLHSVDSQTTQSITEQSFQTDDFQKAKAITVAEGSLFKTTEQHNHKSVNHPSTQTISATAASSFNSVPVKSVTFPEIIQSLTLNYTLDTQMSASLLLEPSSGSLMPNSKSISEVGTPSFDYQQTFSVLPSSEYITQPVSGYSASEIITESSPVTDNLVSTDVLSSSLTTKLLNSAIAVSETSIVTVSMSSDWLYSPSSSVNVEVQNAHLTTVSSSLTPMMPEIVTNRTRFETQTHNNTVATTDSVLKTTPGNLRETTRTLYVNTEFEAADNSSKVLKKNFITTTPENLDLTTETLRPKAFTSKSGSVPGMEAGVNNLTAGDRVEILQEMHNELNALNEGDPFWRFNLYGPSGSKNYLRFPIVTGSNGKFLFSPLSNKDSIDISSKKNLERDPLYNKSKVETNTTPIGDNYSNHLTEVSNGVQKVYKSDVQAKRRSRPKPMVVDWKTPPISKPTNIPNGWESKRNNSNKVHQNESPAGPKVIFSVQSPERANFV